jgi:hypothetical protein
MGGRRLVTVVVLAFLVLVALGRPLPARADGPPVPPPKATATASGPSSGGGLVALPDPKQWASDVFSQVLVTLLQGLASALHAVVSGVMGSSLNFVTQTPPGGSYASPTVRGLWDVVRRIANAALVLVALAGGYNVIVRQHVGATYHDALELLPRLILGAVLANTSLAWCQLVIDLNNALCQAVGQAGLPAWEQADRVTQVLADLTADLIYLVTSLLLLLQMLMRLALVDALLVVAPLALLCWVLPQAHGWARQWGNLFFGAVFTQFVQVLVLKLGGSLLTELTPMAPDSAILAVFLGVAVLALTLKVPGLMRQSIDHGLGFVRFVAYRQGARIVEGGRGASGGGP